MNWRSIGHRIKGALLRCGRPLFHDQVNLVANLRLELRGPDGGLKDVRVVHNTVPTNGKTHYADQLQGTPAQAKMGWMEVGTGTPSATLLGAYISGSRTALTSNTASGAVVTYVCTFAAGVGTGAITECGLFNVVTQNTVTMGLSASFSVVNKAAGDSLTMTWTLTLS